MVELRRSSRKTSRPATTEEKSTEPAAKKVQSKSVKEIKEGDNIPDIKLLDENENEVDLKQEASKWKYLVIFAYPKASTPGCTRQVCGFQANYDYLQNQNVRVFGLSSDTPKAQKNFVTKQHLKFPLLSDPSKKLIGVLGAKKTPSGIKRSHWIFENGMLKVKKIAISPEQSVNTAKSDIESFVASETGDKKSEDSKDAKPAEIANEQSKEVKDEKEDKGKEEKED